MFFNFLQIFLAFLLPIAVYCLILAGINRRLQPVMVSGVWDTVGLLLAASGSLLVGFPGILVLFYVKQTNDSPDSQAIVDTIGQWWLAWVLYYVLVAGGSLLLIWLRRHKSVIYNVGPQQWEQAFAQALARLGLEQSRAGKNIFIGKSGPLEEPTQILAPVSSSSKMEAAVTEKPHRSPMLSGGSALIQVDVFPALCHVTLHWDDPSPLVRQEIETELARALQRTQSPDNPAASWFLGIGGILLGICFLLLMLVFLFTIFSPRH